MLLYLVRHGETDANAQRVYQGHASHPLNAAGRHQAQRLAQALRGVPIKTCWTSDLKRAEETAKIVVAPHARASLQLEPLLRDRGMGSLEGKKWEEHPLGSGVGVEGDDELDARLHTFLDSLVTAHTPLSSPLSTPRPAGVPVPVPVPVAHGLAGVPAGPRTPVSPSDPGNGCVMVVTHEACILALLKMLLQPEAGVDQDEEHPHAQGESKGYFPSMPTTPTSPQSQSPSPASPGSGNGDGDGGVNGGSEPPTPFGTRAKLRSLVRTHASPAVDTAALCGNTAVCVVRVWWEPEPEIVLGPAGAGEMRSEMRAVGRVEAWGDVEHLEE